MAGFNVTEEKDRRSILAEAAVSKFSSRERGKTRYIHCGSHHQTEQ
jgi:hypothetical protein